MVPRAARAPSSRRARPVAGWGPRRAWAFEGGADLRKVTPISGPVLAPPWCRLPLARPGRVSRGRRPSRSRWTLSHRLVGWCGDQLPGLQAETGARVPALPSGRAAPRGAAAPLAHPLRSAAWPAAAGGRAGAARVHALWPRRTRLREALVWHVPDKRPLPVFMSRKVFLPVVREEASAPLGGVASEGSARARSPSPCRPHHATPPARDLPQTAGASARPPSTSGDKPARTRPGSWSGCRSTTRGASSRPAENITPHTATGDLDVVPAKGVVSPSPEAGRCPGARRHSRGLRTRASRPLPGRTAGLRGVASSAPPLDRPPSQPRRG